MVEDQLLTIRQVADFLKVNERTIYRMVNAGKLPAFKVGNSWRIEKSKPENWIEKQQGREASS